MRWLRLGISRYADRYGLRARAREMLLLLRHRDNNEAPQGTINICTGDAR
jgi:hypothetical protein